MRKHTLILLLGLMSAGAFAQDRIYYTGTTLSDPQRHDGGLSPVVGVHNIQIMRANREHPSAANGFGWTYNHQPMMAYWKGKFYVHYLCDEIDEQVPPSHTLLQTSVDGYKWSTPEMLFPEYNVPKGFTKDNGLKADNPDAPLVAVMHQRMGFHVSKDNRLYAIGYYGVCFSKKDHNNDGNGIGRVVREIKEDGSLGPIYFIYYNHGFSEKNTDYPNYKKGDKYLRRACEEMLTNPRVLMQWVEESDRGDALIPVKEDYKAYNDYTLPDGRIVAMWKHALNSVSSDGGKTWERPIQRAKGFVNSNAKIWGQRLSDGMYATVYNPSEYRWPLALSLSKDGLEYTTLNLVNGEVPPMRYGGNYKSFGPQYVRGIQEWNGCPADNDMWLTYSINKEDMWVAHVPVPVRLEVMNHANDDFTLCKALADLKEWNIYSPIEANVALDGKWLVLNDADKFDYCKVERMIPASRELTVDFEISADQLKNGLLHIEFLDYKGTPCSRLEVQPNGDVLCKGGARLAKVGTLTDGETAKIQCQISTTNRNITVFFNGKKATTRMLMAPVESITRVMFRTGTQRSYPTIDTPADWDGILPGAGDSAPLASYKIAYFQTSVTPQAVAAETGDTPLPAAPSLTAQENAKIDGYINHFNTMEDENIVQAIPNSQSLAWVKDNVPYFECSDPFIEEIYWFRWWSLRKHIEDTPVGYAMTEFLVNRNYADKWKLISSGVGHHILESRWIRNPKYLDQIINTWYHGNEGQPMAKLTAYSSWIPYALWQRYLVDGSKDRMTALLPSMQWEVDDWYQWHQFRPDMPFPTKKSGYGKIRKRNEKGINGLFWQSDVRDAMEETISGSRTQQFMRPSINAYMYGNDVALANVARLAGNETLAKEYSKRAAELLSGIEQNLWSDSLQFFLTHSGDSLIAAREAIGFMPWYVNMPIDNNKYGVAWQQVTDEGGFCAPYGLTTAERRHPQFRTHGVGKCEWDGAIWPFATSQTLTALANYVNSQTDGNALEHQNDSNSYGNVFFRELKKYAEAQYKRGHPYIGEYQDEVTGYWLKGDQERSRYYNHSTFCDLVITGLCGLRPQADGSIVVNPLISKDIEYFCLKNVLYHGRYVTIIYDRDGSHYHQGKGVIVSPTPTLP